MAFYKFVIQRKFLLGWETKLRPIHKQYTSEKQSNPNATAHFKNTYRTISYLLWKIKQQLCSLLQGSCSGTFLFYKKPNLFGAFNKKTSQEVVLPIKKVTQKVVCIIY